MSPYGLHCAQVPTSADLKDFFLYTQVHGSSLLSVAFSVGHPEPERGDILKGQK